METFTMIPWGVSENKVVPSMAKYSQYASARSFLTTVKENPNLDRGKRHRILLPTGITPASTKVVSLTDMIATPAEEG